MEPQFTGPASLTVNGICHNLDVERPPVRGPSPPSTLA